MKITLILAAPPHDPLKGREPFMPLSLPLLAGAAPEHDYTIIDQLRNTDPIDFDAPADLVGISTRMTGEPWAYEIADEFRGRGVPVVLGGPQISAVPHRAIEHADAVSVGEGEFLWPRILDDLQKGEFADFYVARPGDFDARGKKVVQLEDWPDLAELPPARRDLLPGNYQFSTVFAARGCPIDCDFCGVPEMFGKKLRMRPLDHVIRDIESFDGFYYILDDTVFGRPGSYDYYLELYDRIATLPNRRFWTGQANLGAVDSETGREVIRAAARAGLLYAAVGMESINRSVLERNGALVKTGLHKASDPIARMKEQIAFIQDLGIFVSGWFTIGYEEDRIETFYETLEFCKETDVLPVISPINALPGTRLYTRLKEENRLDWSSSLTNVPHPHMTKREIIEALDCVVEQGHSWRQRIRRTKKLASRLSEANGNTPKHKIEGTIFSLVFQQAMRDIFHQETRNLESPLSQNFYTKEPPL